MANTKKSGPETAPPARPSPEQPPPAELCHDDADDVTRHSFRGAVGDADHITAEIAGNRHTVLDIGSRGIGLLLSEGMALVPGQTHDLTLAFGGRALTLRGLVRHVTMDDEAGAFHCGIQLLDLSREAEQQLQEFILRQRHHLFTGSDQAPA